MNNDFGSLYHEVPAACLYSRPDSTVTELLHGVWSNTRALSEVAANSMVLVECTFTYNSSTLDAANTL